MSLLPPVGWGEVATHRDLQAFAERIDGRVQTDMATTRAEIAGVRTEMANLRTEFHRDLATATRTMVLSLTSSVFVVGSLAFGAATLV